jgi:hypothetical protein
MLQGAMHNPQKCHFDSAPKFLQRATKAPRTAPSALRLKGAISASRQRHFSRAPASFIWCQLRIAAMPIEQRTKGRVNHE